MKEILLVGEAAPSNLFVGVRIEDRYLEDNGVREASVGILFSE